MTRLCIQKQGTMNAKLRVQGSKNGSLSCLAATLLHAGTTVLKDVPMIEDVFTAIEILKALGVRVSVEKKCVTVQAEHISSTKIPECYVKKMRSSITFAGALLARTGEVTAGYPGGCVLGERPIDFHLAGFGNLGAQVELQETGIWIQARELSGSRIRLPFPSVGATENIILAATSANGITVIENAAREPEIMELADFLNKMGHEIRGAGTSCIVICGKQKTKDICFSLEGDRIAAGTWLLGCMNTGGILELEHVPVKWMNSTLQILKKMGAVIECEDTSLKLKAPEKIQPVSYLETAPYPGIPTDMQSQFLPVLCKANGKSCICEKIFSDRFGIAEQLIKMGARIQISPDKRYACIEGNTKLSGTNVKATDLRGGAALMIAAMNAEGTTVIDDFYHVNRGYENVVETICKLGGKAFWMEERNVK